MRPEGAIDWVAHQPRRFMLYPLVCEARDMVNTRPVEEDSVAENLQVVRD